MNEKLKNIYYSLTAQFLKFLRKKAEFKGKLTFECNFQFIEEVKSKFHFTNNEFYNENEILFSEDMVSVKNGLIIKCISETSKITTFQ